MQRSMVSAVPACPDAVKFAVATFATQFQNDFVRYFNLNYPTHNQDFHNLLMSFNGFERIYEIGMNVSSIAMESFKSMAVDVCVEAASSSSLATTAALGLAAGASIGLLAHKFSLFSSEPVVSTPPPSRQSVERVSERPQEQAESRKSLTAEERKDQLNNLKALKSQHVTKWRDVCLQSVRMEQPAIAHENSTTDNTNSQLRKMTA